MNERRNQRAAESIKRRYQISFVGVVVCLLLLAACDGSNTHSPGKAASRSGGLSRSSTVPAPITTAGNVPEDNTVHFSKSGWKTDFSRHTVPLNEIDSGGPPRDGIPPIDQPSFVSLGEADAFLNGKEPVIALEINGDARAYPIQILIWHEIVNDTVGGQPVTVTFCPLCNTAIAFDRGVSGRVLDFGTTGNLRDSDLVMWDRQTESWWQQFTGTAIVGQLAGTQLTFLPAEIISWQEFKDAHPDGRILARPTGFHRPYGSNPYAGYDKAHEPPFLFVGTPDGRLLPKERVVTVTLNGESVAYPFRVLEKQPAVNDRIGGQPVVVLWQSGTLSPLDQETIAKSGDIGSATVYRAEVDRRRLNFEAAGDAFVDIETGSRWTIAGHAIEGPLKGRQLEPVVHANPFWFAAAAANPTVRIFAP